jgi:hypothetical protein
MSIVMDVEHGLGPQTTVRRLDRDDLEGLASFLPAALRDEPPAMFDASAA